MAHRKRTHRRSHRVQSISSPAVEVDNVATASAENPSVAQSHTTIVGSDLRATALVTLILLGLLVLATYLNSRTGWTLHFGETLYRLLHIR